MTLNKKKIFNKLKEELRVINSSMQRHEKKLALYSSV
jgi:hypothetical protein